MNLGIDTSPQCVRRLKRQALRASQVEEFGTPWTPCEILLLSLPRDPRAHGGNPLLSFASVLPVNFPFSLSRCLNSLIHAASVLNRTCRLHLNTLCALRGLCEISSCATALPSSREALPTRLNIPSKVVENRLPSLALLLNWMSRLGIERDANERSARASLKLD
jgi:hypothetical protein